MNWLLNIRHLRTFQNPAKWVPILGELQKTLQKGEYLPLRPLPMFESNFVQVTHRGVPIYLHHGSNRLTMGVAATLPGLLLPDILLIARPPEGKDSSNLILTRMIPLDLVHLYVHDLTAWRLKLRLVTGRCYYLELDAPSYEVGFLFDCWIRLINLLREPATSWDTGTLHTLPPEHLPQSEPFNSTWRLQDPSQSKRSVVVTKSVFPCKLLFSQKQRKAKALKRKFKSQAVGDSVPLVWSQLESSDSRKKPTVERSTSGPTCVGSQRKIPLSEKPSITIRTIFSIISSTVNQKETSKASDVRFSESGRVTMSGRMMETPSHCISEDSPDFSAVSYDQLEQYLWQQDIEDLMDAATSSSSSLSRTPHTTVFYQCTPYPSAPRHIKARQRASQKALSTPATSEKTPFILDQSQKVATVPAVPQKAAAVPKKATVVPVSSQKAPAEPAPLQKAPAIPTVPQKASAVPAAPQKTSAAATPSQRAAAVPAISQKAPVVSIPAQKALSVPVPSQKAPVVSVPSQKAPVVSVPSQKAEIVSVPAQKALPVPVPSQKAPVVSVLPQKFPHIPALSQKFPHVPAPSQKVPLVTIPSKKIPVVPVPSQKAPHVTAPSQKVLPVTVASQKAPVVPVSSQKAPHVTVPSQKAPPVTGPSRKAPVVPVPSQKAPRVIVPSQKVLPVAIPSQKAPVVPVPSQKTPHVTVPSQKVPPVTVASQKAPVVPVPSQKAPHVTVPSQKVPPVTVASQKAPVVPVPSQKTPPIPLQSQRVPPVPVSSPKASPVPIASQKVPSVPVILQKPTSPSIPNRKSLFLSTPSQKALISPTQYQRPFSPSTSLEKIPTGTIMLPAEGYRKDVLERRQPEAGPEQVVIMGAQETNVVEQRTQTQSLELPYGSTKKMSTEVLFSKTQELTLEGLRGTRKMEDRVSKKKKEITVDLSGLKSKEMEQQKRWIKTKELSLQGPALQHSRPLSVEGLALAKLVIMANSKEQHLQPGVTTPPSWLSMNALSRMPSLSPNHSQLFWLKRSPVVVREQPESATRVKENMKHWVEVEEPSWNPEDGSKACFRSLPASRSLSMETSLRPPIPLPASRWEDLPQSPIPLSPPRMEAPNRMHQQPVRLSQEPIQMPNQQPLATKRSSSDIFLPVHLETESMRDMPTQVEVIKEELGTLPDLSSVKRPGSF